MGTYRSCCSALLLMLHPTSLSLTYLWPNGTRQSARVSRWIILKEETTEGEGEGEVVVVEWFDMPDGRMFYACCIGPGTDEFSYKFNLYPASGKRLSSESKLERVREVSK
ncbi:hypothetical protein YC2023_046436 [Brassica napus]